MYVFMRGLSRTGARPAQDGTTGFLEVEMSTLVLSALVLLLVTPAIAADPPKAPSTIQSQTPAPAIQSDAVKPLTQPNVVTPPTAKPVPPPAPPGSGPGVSGPKAGPGAPAAGPTVPTLPAAAVPGIDPTLRDANQLDAIRDLKQLEQLNRDPLQRGRPAGTEDGGLPRTLGTGRVSEPPGHQGTGVGRDCFPNPQGCLDEAGGGFGSGNAADRMGGPPTLGGALGNPGGAASGDGPSSTPRQRAESRIGKQTSESTDPPSRNEDGQTTTHETSSHENGSRDTTVTTEPNGTKSVSERFSFRDGGHTVIVDGSDSNGTTHYHEEVDGAGNGSWYGAERASDGRIVRELKGSIVGGRHSRHTGGSDSQPREDPAAGTGRNDGCHWAPIHGCLNPREDIRTTIRQQTTQPGINPDGQGTEGGTGSSRGGSTGPEAVTNTGDGSFGVQRSGNSGHGTPIWQTMPDPARGGPGGPAPGSPAGRAGSDAGLDASLGAVPPPPPPPR